MYKLRDLILKGLRKTYRNTRRIKFGIEHPNIDRVLSNIKIFELLSGKNPCMISRFGTGEIGIINNYLAVHDDKSLLKRCYRYITDNTGLPWWDKLFFKSMRLNAGIFPETIETLEKFSERYLRDIPEIDILGSFNYAEKFMPLREDITKVHLECLYPFFVDNPWTKALEGKKVLVVHPFTESIQYQYKQRTKIFNNESLWPDYELKLVRAVQSNAGNKVSFRNWFEALEFMEEEIIKIDFDICILGCGAYGLPLAAFVKRMGKKSIHIGGGTQLLFGIKGKRWDNNSYYWADLPHFNTNYSSLYNEYWVRPSVNETPLSAKKVEGACYW